MTQTAAKYDLGEHGERLLDHAETILRAVSEARDKRFIDARCISAIKHLARLEDIAEQLKMLALDLERQGVNL